MPRRQVQPHRYRALSRFVEPVKILGDDLDGFAGKRRRGACGQNRSRRAWRRFARPGVGVRRGLPQQAKHHADHSQRTQLQAPAQPSTLGNSFGDLR